METLGHILAAITFIYLWDTKIREKIFFKQNGVSKPYRIKLFRVIDTAPIIGEWLNCATCLSFWTGLTMFYFTNDIFLLSLPLAYKGVIKLIS